MMARTKRVFISDIHMGTAESIEGGSPYGWLLADRARLLAEFLDELAKDETLAELVIVGDLFDEWVVPYPVAPVPSDGSSYADQFAKIAAAPQNKPVIAGLRTLAESGKVRVSYVPGNHDMLIEQQAIAQLISDKVHTEISGPGQGVYSAGSIAAEHGSLYCMFNAPDVYDNPGHSLPLGFFVARSQAEGTTTGHPVTKRQYIEVLLDALARMVAREEIAQAVFDAIVDAVQTPTRSIAMDGINRYAGEITTTDVSTLFRALFSEWDKKMTDNVPAAIAAIGEAAMLYPAALLRYAIPWFEERQPHNIVVFGHTHVWEIRGLALSLKSVVTLAGEIAAVHRAVEQGDQRAALKRIEQLDDTGSDRAADFIYVNSGTWIDGDSGVAGSDKPPATYVVVDTTSSRTTASVYRYDGGALYQPANLLDSRFTIS